MSILSRWISKTVSEVIQQRVPQLLDERLPGVVDRVIRKTLSENPNRQLTSVGFDWAIQIAMGKFWPDVPPSEAIRWVKEYVGASYGDPAYEWTASAAEDLVRMYVEDFGEAA